MHGDKTLLGIRHIFKSLTASLLVAIFLVSCGGKEPVDPTPTPGPGPDPKPPVETKDTKAPTITVKITEKNVIAGVVVSLKDNQLLFDQDIAASWTDDISKSCKVELSLLPSGGQSKTINSGDKLEEAGTLQIKVLDEAGNSSSAEIKLTLSDTKAPEIEVKISEKNVVAGVKIKVEGNQLFFDQDVAATWKDDYSENCTVELSIAGKKINSGDVLFDAGTLVLSVADEFQNKSTAEITLTTVAIYGLEGLNNLFLQVDKEVNLLQGVTFAEGISLEKVGIEISGQRVDIQDPTHYTPELPGIISLVLTLTKPDGSIIEVKVEDLAVNALDFTSPALETADVVNNNYPWFNNMTQWYKEHGYDPSVWNNKKNFVYPHVLVSYITGDRYRLDNLEYIMVGEVPTNYPCENVGVEGFLDHANSGYKHIKDMTPFATVKACGGMWTNALEYVSSHPEYNFMLSCAADGLGGDTAEELRKSDNYKALKELLNMENVIVSVASMNIRVNCQRVPNENSETVSGEIYVSASVNSEKNNKITVTGYNPAKNNIFLDDLQSRLPIGFPGACKGNIIIPFVSLAGFDDGNLITSTSSDPTGATSSTLGNFLSILVHNHPGASLEDANTIMQERYLRPENYKYKDEDGTIKEGGLWYFFKTDEFLKEEVLHEPEVVAALQNTPKSLPSQGGLCYEGPGIQFTIDGSTYDMTEDNRSTLENAVKTEKEIVWSYNSDRARKYGVSESNSITVKVMDRQAHLVPDVSFSIQIN